LLQDKISLKSGSLLFVSEAEDCCPFLSSRTLDSVTNKSALAKRRTTKTNKFLFDKAKTEKRIISVRGQVYSYYTEK